MLLTYKPLNDVDFDVFNCTGRVGTIQNQMGTFLFRPAAAIPTGLINSSELVEISEKIKELNSKVVTFQKVNSGSYVAKVHDGQVTLGTIIACNNGWRFSNERCTGFGDSKQIQQIFEYMQELEKKDKIPF